VAIEFDFPHRIDFGHVSVARSKLASSVANLVIDVGARASARNVSDTMPQYSERPTAEATSRAIESSLAHFADHVEQRLLCRVRRVSSTES